MTALTKVCLVHLTFYSLLLYGSWKQSLLSIWECSSLLNHCDYVLLVKIQSFTYEFPCLNLLPMRVFSSSLSHVLVYITCEGCTHAMSNFAYGYSNYTFSFGFESPRMVTLSKLHMDGIITPLCIEALIHIYFVLDSWCFAVFCHPISMLKWILLLMAGMWKMFTLPMNGLCLSKIYLSCQLCCQMI